MIDAHCHVHFLDDAEVTRALKRARHLGIVGLITCDDGRAHHRQRLLDVVASEPDVYGCLGIHPWTVDSLLDTPLDSQLNALSALLRQRDPQRIVAIGESGLDFYTATSATARAAQQRALSLQLMMAEEHDLPIVLHNVRANEALYHAIRDVNVSCMLHGFTSSAGLARQFLSLQEAPGRGDRKIVCSFGAALLSDRGGRARDALAWVAEQYPQCWTLETDAPHGAHAPDGKMLSGPAALVALYDVVAEVLGSDAEAVARQAAEHARAFFSL